MEAALYYIESMRTFAGLALLDDAIPDATTILKFRRRLERAELTSKVLNTINDFLEARGGTMLDATIIHAALSTKILDKARDPDLH